MPDPPSKPSFRRSTGRPPAPSPKRSMVGRSLRLVCLTGGPPWPYLFPSMLSMGTAIRSMLRRLCSDDGSTTLEGLLIRNGISVTGVCLLMAHGTTNRGESPVQQSFRSAYLLPGHDLIFASVAQERYVRRLPASWLPTGKSLVRQGRRSISV